MLRAGLATSMRPLIKSSVFSPAARCRPQVFSSARAFGTKPNVLRFIQNRPSAIVSPSLLSKFTRGIATDGAVVTQASQAQAWKKFGITAVSDPIVLVLYLLTSPIAHSCRDRRRCRGILEQRHPGSAVDGRAIIPA